MGVTIIKGQGGGGLRPGVYLEGGRNDTPRRSQVDQDMHPWPPKEFCDRCGDPRLIHWYVSTCKQIECGGKYAVNQKLARAFREK